MNVAPDEGHPDRQGYAPGLDHRRDAADLAAPVMALLQQVVEKFAASILAWAHDELRARDAELDRLRAELERVRAATAEAIIRDCIPGGSICDPQQVADAIRAWAQEPPA